MSRSCAHADGAPCGRAQACVAQVGTLHARAGGGNAPRNAGGVPGVQAGVHVAAVVWAVCKAVSQSAIDQEERVDDAATDAEELARAAASTGARSRGARVAGSFFVLRARVQHSTTS